MSKDKGLKSKEEMKPTGTKTGVKAVRDFQAKGKSFLKDTECLGLAKDEIKTLTELGLVK